MFEKRFSGNVRHSLQECFFKQALRQLSKSLLACSYVTQVAEAFVSEG